MKQASLNLMQLLNTNRLKKGSVILLLLSASVQAEVSPDVMVDVFKRLDALELDNRKLRGENQALVKRVTDMQNKQKQLLIRMDERIDDLSKRSQASGQRPALAAPAAVPQTTLPTSTANAAPNIAPAIPAGAINANAVPQQPAAPAPQNAVKIVKTNSAAELTRQYNALFELMKNKQYPQAVNGFKQFIRLNPRHELSANSQYWIGEIHYANGDFKNAIQGFLEVLKNYKNSPKAPDAGLKLGYSFYELQNWDMARKTFEDVEKFYPSTNSAKLAKARITQMKGMQ